MLIFDLILATRRPVMTGVERYGALLFSAMRKIAPDTLAVVRDPSLFSDRSGLIAVDDVYKGWLALPLELRRRGLSPQAVIFPTAPASPLFLPTRHRLLRIAHDAFPWTRAEAMPLKGQLLYRHIETFMAQRYDLFCGTTEVVADDLKAHVRRTDVAWCGNAPCVDFAGAEESEPAGVPEKFILAVGTVEPRKNYARLAALVDAGGPNALPVVLVGRPGWGEITATIERLAAERPKRFIWLRDLSGDAGLLWLYRRASCFLTLSLAEGFNMPLAEAGSCGRPLLCSDLPVHRLVAPPWASFVTAEAPPEELWRRIHAATAPTAQEVEAYRRRFSFDAIAQRLLEIVERSAASSVDGVRPRAFATSRHESAGST
jgi:glycosyltransferase involved in cell wall biosynthesis